MKPHPDATIGAFGDLKTDRHSYQPLDEVEVQVTGRSERDNECRIQVYDANLSLYFEIEVPLYEERGTISFVPAQALGVHWIFLYFGKSERHSRYCNFVLECETAIETGCRRYDSLYKITKEALMLSRREFNLTKGKMVGYISGDTWALHGIWLRDWIYQLPAYQHWERELVCGLDRFLEAQNPDGSVPDGIRRDGSQWRMSVESDVEYIMVLGIYGTWKITGDDDWLMRVLPCLEKALAYVQKDDLRWDREHQLVKRGHTCDTWDFEIKGKGKYRGKRRVVATCDQSGYYLAFLVMAEMYSHLGRKDKAEVFSTKADQLRIRANNLLWDGKKYRHHVHLAALEHPDFREEDQLAMGNVWALTRGLADHQSAKEVINEYRRRHEETGDAFPWWSLQPGYPDELGYYDAPHLRQGGYANGGLMPWVGGELCRACFEHGFEEYGLELFSQYWDFMCQSENRVHVWYWPNGEPGFRTTNEVPHTGWGMAQWLEALFEGLAGFLDKKVKMREMRVSPRWTAAKIHQAYAVFRYGATRDYFAYRINIDLVKKEITLDFTGSGKKVNLRILLPYKWHVDSCLVGSKSIKVQEEKIEESVYAVCDSKIEGARQLKLVCHSRS